MNETATELQKRYAHMVSALKKNPGDIILNERKRDLLHMALGLAGETGELVDAIKKHTIYDQDLSMLHIIEELGDIEFYLEGFRQALGVCRYDSLAANIEKLSQRYPDGTFTREHAAARLDKKDPS